MEHGNIISYGKLQGIDNYIAYRLLYDDKGQVWMATDKGLYILNPVKNQLKYFTEKEGVPRDDILDLLEDERNRVTVGSFSGGLSMIEQNAQMVHPVGTKFLSTMLEDSEGKNGLGRHCQ